MNCSKTLPLSSDHIYAEDLYSCICIDLRHKIPFRCYNDVLVQYTDIHISYDWTFLSLPHSSFRWLSRIRRHEKRLGMFFVRHNELYLTNGRHIHRHTDAIRWKMGRKIQTLDAILLQEFSSGGNQHDQEFELALRKKLHVQIKRMRSTSITMKI